MPITKLVTELVAASMYRKAKMNALKNAEHALESAKEKFKEKLKRLGNQIIYDFEVYLHRHAEIPRETYQVCIVNKDHWNRVNESEKVLVPFNNQNISLDIIIGIPEDPNGRSSLDAIDVSSKFLDFIEKNKPFNIRVLRHFNDTHIVTFYGLSGEY